HVVREQRVRRQHSSKARLPVAAGQTEQALTRANIPRREQPAHNIDLPITQPERLPSTLTRRHPQILFRERNHTLPTTLRQTRKIHARGRDRSLRARPTHSHHHPPESHSQES